MPAHAIKAAVQIEVRKNKVVRAGQFGLGLGRAAAFFQSLSLDAGSKGAASLAESYLRLGNKCLLKAVRERTHHPLPDFRK